MRAARSDRPETGSTSPADASRSSLLVGLARGAAALLAFLTTYFFSVWMGPALLRWKDVPVGAVHYGALLLALATAVLVWRCTAGSSSSIARSVAVGALITGSVGLAAGLLGPLLLAPETNHGVALGLFLTGPLGFVLGGLGGGVFWLLRRQEPPGSPPRGR